MLYRFLHLLARFVLALFFRWEVRGRENIPLEGPLIVVSNHMSHADPIVVGGALTRPVYFMAKEDLFKKPFLRWLITNINAFPVKRGSADRGAIKRGMEILKEGKVLGIFPEGGRRDDPRVEEAKQGAAFLAAKTGAPIVPIAVSGTNRVLPRGSFLPRLAKIRVNIGQPIRFVQEEEVSRKQALSRFSEKIMEEIIRLGAEYKEDLV